MPMEPAFILLGILAAVGLLLWLLDRRHGADGAPTAPTDEHPAARGCEDAGCALHEVCGTQQRGKGCDDKALYFEDEELDVFKGRNADEYTDDETAQFHEVLCTLRPGEVIPWRRSLHRRGIALPASLRQEANNLAKCL